MTQNASSPSSLPAVTGTSVRSLFVGLAPLFLIVFFGFLAIGISLAPLSVQVQQVLGFNTIVVGLVVGLQSLVTVACRHRSGTLSDQHGPKRAVLSGLPLTALGGIAYLLSVGVVSNRAYALGAILLGRIVLGVGESLFITGAMSWGISRMGRHNTGKVMAWQGIAMYGAMGLGAMIGLGLQGRFGFTGVSYCVLGAPLIALLVAFLLPAVPPSGGTRLPFHQVLGLIWRPGSVLALATAPYAGMATFLALYYAHHHWTGAGFALAAFGAGYIVVRLFAAHLPDKIGGLKVARVSLIVECVGQFLLWQADTPTAALAGALLTGCGFSLIFPSMGVEAARRIAPEQRGQAVGNFIGFFDLSIGLTGPIVGFAATRLGDSVVFLFGGLVTTIALVLLLIQNAIGSRSDSTDRR